MNCRCLQFVYHLYINRNLTNNLMIFTHTTFQCTGLRNFLLLLFFIAITAASHPAWAQNGVGINAAGAPADGSAMLDISSTSKGMLVPRMTSVQRTAIASPANGLLIYQTDAPAGFWYFDGSIWIQAVGPQGATGPQGPQGAAGPAPSGTGLVTVAGGVLGVPADLSGDITTSGGGISTTISNGAVTSAKILDGTIANADVATGAGISLSKLAAVTANRIAISDASGFISTGGAGTSNTVLHGNASGAPAYGSVALSADVSGILPAANGGTGSSSAFTTGSVIFAGASGVYSQNNGSFFWDNSNNRLGINASAPDASLQIGALASVPGSLHVYADNATNASKVYIDGYNFSTANAALLKVVKTGNSATSTGHSAIIGIADNYGGSNVGKDVSSRGICGYTNAVSSPYTWGVAGYRIDNAGGPSAGVMGAVSDANAPTAWGALGFQDASSNEYGGYFMGNAIAGSATPNAVMGTHPSYGNSYAAWFKLGSDYTVLTDGTNSFFNMPLSAGQLYLRAANVTKMTIDGTTGNTGIATAPSATSRLFVTNNLSGAAVLTTSSAGRGVEGQATAATFHGLAGFNTVAAGLSSGDGVLGSTAQASGYGVRGINTNATFSASTGVLGISGPGGSVAADFYGVVGTANTTNDNWGYGGYFTGEFRGVYAVNPTATLGYAVYYSGNLAGTGTKSCVVRTSQGPTLLYCQESPENWFEDFGSGKMVNGHVTINMDPVFLETVTIDASHPFHVFIQFENDAPAKFDIIKSSSGFEVADASGLSNGEFSWRLAAKRKGYEDHRLRNSFAYDDPALYPDPNDPSIPAEYRQKAADAYKARVRFNSTEENRVSPSPIEAMQKAPANEK
jgi:hypothetical protein